MFTLDRIAINHIHNSTKTGGIIEYIFAIFAVSFNNEIVAFVYGLGLFLLPYSPENILIVLLPLSGLLVTFILKRKISRPRPSLFFPRAEKLKFDLRGREKNHSMPSGDSLQAGLFWTLMCYYQVVPLWLGVVLALFTMIGRVYYMCHYPTDTLFGALLGMSLFYVVKNIMMLP